MTRKVSRNDPCPCGSNKKYKNCHGRKGIRFNARLFKRAILAVIIIAVAAWAGKQFVFTGDTGDSVGIPAPNEQPTRVTPLVPQPPGPAPEGKVWSPEHGHWHNAAYSDSGGQPQYHPKPPGLPPPGKIWSYEHGHWHDSSYTGNENYTPGPPPPGPAPEGKVWSYEHGHWHDADPGQNQTPTKQPVVNQVPPSQVKYTPKRVEGGD